jgi:hypothetical protein
MIVSPVCGKCVEMGQFEPNSISCSGKRQLQEKEEKGGRAKIAGFLVSRFWFLVGKRHKKKCSG